MCSHNVNFIHKIKNSFKSIWLLRFYGFPFYFISLVFIKRLVRSIRLSIFQLKNSCEFLQKFCVWCSVESQFRRIHLIRNAIGYFFIDSLKIVLASRYVRFYHQIAGIIGIFLFLWTYTYTYTQIHITCMQCISIVCCCGILLPNLVSTCGSLIGCIRSPSASTSPSVSSLHFYYLETFFPLHWNSTLIARRTLATMRFKNRREKKFFFFSF